MPEALDSPFLGDPVWHYDWPAGRKLPDIAFGTWGQRQVTTVSTVHTDLGGQHRPAIRRSALSSNVISRLILYLRQLASQDPAVEWEPAEFSARSLRRGVASALQEADVSKEVIASHVG